MRTHAARTTACARGAGLLPICPSGAPTKPCQPLRTKIFLFSEFLIWRISLPFRDLSKGRIAIAVNVVRNAVDVLMP